MLCKSSSVFRSFLPVKLQPYQPLPTPHLI
jgi:hypothetical protein